MRKLTRVLGLVVLGFFLRVAIVEVEQIDWELTWQRYPKDKPFNNLSEKFKWVEENQKLPLLRYLAYQPDFYNCLHQEAEAYMSECPIRGLLGK